MLVSSLSVVAHAKPPLQSYFLQLSQHLPDFGYLPLEVSDWNLMVKQHQSKSTDGDNLWVIKVLDKKNGYLSIVPGPGHSLDLGHFIELTYFTTKQKKHLVVLHIEESGPCCTLSVLRFFWAEDYKITKEVTKTYAPKITWRSFYREDRVKKLKTIVGKSQPSYIARLPRKGKTIEIKLAEDVESTNWDFNEEQYEQYLSDWRLVKYTYNKKKGKFVVSYGKK